MESGFVVITDRFVCLLGPEATASTAASVHRLLAADDTALDDIFDSVLTRHELQRFAVVEVLDALSRCFHVTVRGDVLVELEGTAATRLSGAANTSWISSEARGVTSLRLSLQSGYTDANPLPLRDGVVRACSVAVGTSVEKSATAAPKPRVKQGVAASRKIPLPSSLSKSDQVYFAVTPAETHPSLWVLTLPDGSEVEASLPIVIGRRQVLMNPDGSSVVNLLAPSPRREISSSHLELAVVDGELRGRDLDSANGTVVHTDSRPPRLLHGGRTTSLRSGDILDIGEEFSVIVGTRD